MDVCKLHWILVENELKKYIILMKHQSTLAESVGAFLLGGIFIGATVGAALKKVAVSILTNPKALKKVGIVVGSILLAILMPIIAIVSFFTGNFNIDTSGIQQKIEASLTAEQKAQMAEAERF